ncbi:MAG TPA: hypothetical protein VKU77_26635 [Streptosporangiaceae bacterium]|nr:hypothetical protein [Streptosporangiaceae bacterium]
MTDPAGHAPDPLTALDARFGKDPDALAWARGHVEQLRDRYRRFEGDARGSGATERAARWRRMASMLDMQLIGGTGCVITPFDERRPSLPDAGEVPW